MGGAQPDQTIPVPSGQVVTLMEVIWNERGPDGLAARFRFLAPAISKNGGAISADQAEADMRALCHDFALSRVQTVTGPKPSQIIISMSDQPVAFGETHPEITQYFDSFTLTNGDCVWSLF